MGICDSRYHWQLLSNGVYLCTLAGCVANFLKITSLWASTNNYVSTVLNLFLDAKAKYGMLSHMRGDWGGENIDVAMYVVARQGPNRGSFLWGS